VEKPDLKPPKRFQPSAALARALDFQNILGLGGEGILALAEASFQEARRLQPLDARRVFDLAQLNHLWGLHGRQERLEMALRYFAETAELSPNRLAVQVNWAMVYLDKNQPQVALERIQSAQSIGHESWFIHYALALIHNKLGNREVALKEAETAVRIRNLWDRIPKEFIPKLEEELKLPPGSLSKGI
jgi:tetratricopeptide (TPR) repeat protein